MTTIDVLGDGGIIKEILREGNGWQTPLNGTEVETHYVGKLLDGTIFDSSRDRDQYFTFTVGAGKVIRGWEEVIKTMKLGELCNVTLTPEYAYGESGAGDMIPGNATLMFEMELVSFDNEKDVSEDKDRTVLKTIIQEGDGYQKPTPEAMVVVSIVARVGEEEVHAVSNEQVILGLGDLPLGVEMGLISMKVGEKAYILVQPGYNMCKEGTQFAALRNSEQPVQYELFLHAFEKGEEPWKYKSFDELFEQANIRKDQGNELFAAGHFYGAQKKYEKALLFVEKDATFDEDEKELTKELRISCNANLSLVLIKQNKFKEALDAANKTLSLDFQNTKGLYRRGLAYVELDQWENAKRDFNLVLELDPGNKAAARSKSILNKKIAKQNAKDKKRFEGLFDKIRD